MKTVVVTVTVNIISSEPDSNVDIIKEMMDMIMTQKGLELLGKAMQAGEQMLKAGMGMT